MANRTIVGVSIDHEHTRALLSELEKSGISPVKVSVLVFEHAGSAMATDDSARLYEETSIHRQATVELASGADGSSVLSRGLSTISVPILGAFLAAGPMLATLRTIGAAAAAGVIAGGLVGYGIPAPQAEDYERILQSGATLIAAHCDSDAQLRMASESFARSGLTNIVSSIQEPFCPPTIAPIRAINSPDGGSATATSIATT